MKYILLFAFTFLMGPVAFAGDLPVVDLQRFQPGASWIWDYFENDELYSSEKYTVLTVKGDNVLIEMSTKLPTDTDFRTHHKIEVSIKKCLKAYANPNFEMNWTIRMFYQENGQWQEIFYQKPLAFTEKFNCNPHKLSGKSGRETLFSEVNGYQVFQQKKTTRPGGSWYFLSGENAGLAIKKDFAKSTGPTYHFKLRQ